MDNVRAEALTGALLTVAAAIDRLADNLAGPPAETEEPWPVAEPAYQVAEIRQLYPHAYARWSPKDDATLREAYEGGQDVESLAVAFGRNTGAIRARLMHLGLPPDQTQDPALDQGRERISHRSGKNGLNRVPRR